MIKINLEEYNNVLEKYEVILRATYISKDRIILNNGKILTHGSDIRRFRRGIKNNAVEFITRIDTIYGDDVTASLNALKEIKSIGASKGGKEVWRKSGDIIREKLKGRTPYNKGISGIYKHGPRSQQIKEKISKANSGKNNGMFGTTMSDADKRMRSKKMKELILQGKFTPNSNNRNTHWNASLDGRKYRSSWEALYQFINPSAEYEALRIEYFIDATTKIYIVDFVDHINKIVVEVKPRELCTGLKFESKMSALTNWANITGYSILIVDAQWLILQLRNVEDYTRFDNNTARKLKSLYETNKKN